MMENAEPFWFARWEEELPSPEELMPLSQSLITPDLAFAFNISDANPSPAQPPTPDFTYPNFSVPPEPVSGVSDSDEPAARSPARPRLVWTPQLHKRFVEAVDHLGNKNAVPKTIMQLMSVEGLTRENVASHLQKYRIYRNRMHSLSSSGGSMPAVVDAATEQLFASNHIPHPFLSRMPGQQPYMQIIAPPYPHHHWQMEATPSASQLQKYYHQSQMRHFLSPLDLLRPMGVSAIGTMQPQNVPSLPNFYGEDMHSETGGRGRRVLTLFPTGNEE